MDPKYLKPIFGWAAVLWGFYWLGVFLFRTAPALHIAGYGMASLLCFFVAKRLFRNTDKTAKSHCPETSTVTKEEAMNPKYCVVVESAGRADLSPDTGRFNQAVASKMAEGWTVQGGVSATIDLSDQWCLSQAMVKTDP